MRSPDVATLCAVTLRRHPLLVIAPLALVIAVVTGCGSGFNATARQSYAPGDGIQAGSGDLRVVSTLVVAPEGSSDGAVLMAVVNNGANDEEITSVDTDAGTVEFTGSHVIPAGKTVVFGAVSTGIGLAEDMQTGLVDRFRSLPMARSAVLAGRTTSDLAKNFLLVAIVIGIGNLVGFRFKNGILGAVGVLLLALAVGFTFSWAMACIGLWLKKVEAVQAASFTLIFPIVFVSSAFVPVAGMKAFLQPIARNNPVTVWCNLARYLSNGLPGILDLNTRLPVDTFQGLLVKSVLWIALLLMIFVPLAIRLYRKLD